MTFSVDSTGLDIPDAARDRLAADDVAARLLRKDATLWGPEAEDEAAGVMRSITEAGIDLDDVFRILEEEGVQKFVDSWDELTASVRAELEDKK